MEVAGGKSGLRLFRWIVGAGIRMLLPLVELAASCSEQKGVDIPCPLNELTGVNCSYVKGIPAGLPVLPDGSRDFEGSVYDLHVRPFLKYSGDGDCLLHFNITWKIHTIARHDLRGFVLNVTFLFGGIQRYIYRTYSLSVANWNNLDLYETAFRHECIQPVNALYRIEVYTLPLSKSARKTTSFGAITYVQMESVAHPSSCDSPDDPDMTYNWTATMWTKQSLSKDNFSSLEVCFFFAPAVFAFNEYKMSLMDFSSTDKTLKDEYIQDNGTQKQNRQECVKFNKICPGIYKVVLRPMTEMGSCVCRAGKNDCKEECIHTVLEPINMTTSTCSPPPATTTPPPPDATAQPPPPTQDTESTTDGGTPSAVSDEESVWNGGKLAGIALVGLSVLAMIVVVLYIRRRRSHRVIRLGSSSGESDITALDKRRPVLLVYSTDNESHRKVVRSFAAFLHVCCGCDVIYDEWSQVDIAQTNPIDWLLKQLYSVRHVIVVNSLGAHLQHRAWIERNPCIADANLLLPDVFVPALRQIQSKTLLGSPQLRCFHVRFPYTEPKHVLDLSCGRCYRLMENIEDLFLNIHGLSKFSAKGTTYANQVNATNYCLKAKEGISLRGAIEEAGHYAREHPDWFQRYYRRADSGPGEKNGAVVAGGCERSNRLLGTESSSRNCDDANEEGETSSTGTAFDMGYVPPSPEGSHSGEMHSVSPDAGVEGTNFLSTFEASSYPPMFDQFAPLPPDELDDASSIETRHFVAKVNELNKQYDSG